MIVLSEIQKNPEQVKQLPALLKKRAAKKPLPDWYLEMKAEVAKMTRAEVIAMMDETLASFDRE